MQKFFTTNEGIQNEGIGPIRQDPVFPERTEIIWAENIEIFGTQLMGRGRDTTGNRQFSITWRISDIFSGDHRAGSGTVPLCRSIF